MIFNLVMSAALCTMLNTVEGGILGEEDTILTYYFDHNIRWEESYVENTSIYYFSVSIQYRFLFLIV